MWAAGVEEAVVAGAAEASVAAEDLVAAVGADLVVVAAAALVAVDLAVAAAALVAVVAVGALVAGVAHENCHCSSHHSLYSDTFMRTGSLFVFRDGNRYCPSRSGSTCSAARTSRPLDLAVFDLFRREKLLGL